MATLLEKAKRVPFNRRLKIDNNKEVEAVALAWVRGEVSLSQIATAMNINGTGYQCYAIIAHALKDYINNKIKEK